MLTVVADQAYTRDRQWRWQSGQTYCSQGLTLVGCIDHETTSRIKNASASFGRLNHRLWSDHGICTKYKDWCSYILRPVTAIMKKLDQFHLRCFRKMWGIFRKDRIPMSVERCKIEGIEAFAWRKQNTKGALLRGAGRWSGFTRYKDVLRYHLRTCDIPGETWDRRSVNRLEQRTACWVGVERFLNFVASSCLPNMLHKADQCETLTISVQKFTHRLDQPPQKACHPP